MSTTQEHIPGTHHHEKASGTTSPSVNGVNSGQFNPTDSYGSGADLNRSYTVGGHEVETNQPAFSPYHRRLANPSPLGLMAFATTTLLLSLINVRTRSLTIPNVVISLAFFYGGLAQFIAGMWEGAAGNTFAFTAFSSYGAFWAAYGYLLTSGTLDAYGGGHNLSNALGLWLAMWFIVTFIFFLATFRQSIALLLLFGFLDMAFLLLAIGELRYSVGCTKAGGWFGIITAFIAFYTSASGLLTRETSLFVLPVGPLGADRFANSTQGASGTASAAEQARATPDRRFGRRNAAPVA